MEKMLVAVFDGVSQAQEGARILRELDATGVLSLFGLALVAKDRSGKLSLVETGDGDRYKTAKAGLLTASLVGLLRVPEEPVVASRLAGALSELARVGIGADVVGEVAGHVPPGKSAVVVEIWEEWAKPVDVRLQAAGATVVRRLREQVLHDRIEREAGALMTELADLASDRTRAAQGGLAALTLQIAAGKERVRATQERIKVTLTAEAEEAGAKVKDLRAKLAQARGEERARVEARIAELQSEFSRRSELLREAWEITKQAMGL